MYKAVGSESAQLRGPSERRYTPPLRLARVSTKGESTSHLKCNFDAQRFSFREVSMASPIVFGMYSSKDSLFTCMFPLICPTCSKRAPSGFDPDFFSHLCGLVAADSNLAVKALYQNVLQLVASCYSDFDLQKFRVERSRQIAMNMQTLCYFHRPRRCPAVVRRQQAACQVSSRRHVEWLRSGSLGEGQS